MGANPCTSTPAGKKKRKRKQRMHTSEVMTIRVNFHQSKYRTFKDYYLKEVSEHLQWAFPNLVIYGFRFLELMPETWLALWAYLRTRFRTQSPSACCQLFCKYRSCFDCLYVSREETFCKSARLSGNQRFTGTHFPSF